MVTPLPGINMDDWRCARVLQRRERVDHKGRKGIHVITCGGFVAWIPRVHIRRSGEPDDSVLMGSGAMCIACRLQFKKADLLNLTAWDSIKSAYAVERGQEPLLKDIEIEWLDLADYLKQVSP